MASLRNEPLNFKKFGHFGPLHIGVFRVKPATKRCSAMGELWERLILLPGS
jgi:hypothetical protein